MRLRRRNLWTSLNSRCAGLAGDLTAQLAADLDAINHERWAAPAVRYVEIQPVDGGWVAPLGDGCSGPGGPLPARPIWAPVAVD